MQQTQEGTSVSPGYAREQSGPPTRDLAPVVAEHFEQAPHECRGMQIKDVLARVGDKWSLCVVGAIYSGPVRFNELKRQVGVSQRMLTLTLRGLERDGLVTRTVYPSTPPSVEYALTDLGRTLVGPVLALVQWSETHLAAIDQARRNFDARARRDAAS